MAFDRDPRAVDVSGPEQLAEAQAVLLDSIDAQIWYLTEPDRLGLVNRAYAHFAGMEPGQMAGRLVSELFPDPEARACVAGNRIAFEEKRQVVVEETVAGPDGEPQTFLVNKTPRLRADGTVEYVVCYGVDITERKRIEEERDRLIGELREAAASIKQLSGLLPICASCKKIRDDRGYWNQIEAYLMKHSDAQFTHGLCPECIRVLYGEYEQG
jgi:PAS domain S-box-containing protein